MEVHEKIQKLSGEYKNIHTLGLTFFGAKSFSMNEMGWLEYNKVTLDAGDCDKAWEEATGEQAAAFCDYIEAYGESWA